MPDFCTFAGLCKGHGVKPLSPLHSSSPPLCVDVLCHLDQRPLVEGQILWGLTGEVKQSYGPLLSLHRLTNQY